MPIATLRSDTFNLPWGSSIYAQVIAVNIVGDSLVSDTGNGATILTTPDAPVNLVQDDSTTNSNSIGFIWEEGAANGGTAVVEYRIWYAPSESTSFQVLE